jgi:hypothetical protein
MNLIGISIIFIRVSLTILMGYVVLSNLTPFGVNKIYKSNFFDKNGIALYPGNRVNPVVVNSENLYKQVGDMIYFSTDAPFRFDAAKVKITYKNNNPDQSLFLGFQDSEAWHYQFNIIDSPLMNSLKINRLEGRVSLYQKNSKYSSVGAFLDSPPQNTTVGIFNLDNLVLGRARTKLEDYLPAASPTLIDTPLRGKHVLYAYLENEPFHMTIQKQDLNWYEGEDVATVNIFKDGDLVYSVTAGDDGITNDSGDVASPQNMQISNPGPELPESGVYKVVIDATGDTVIRSIKTNLHKIVFESPIFPIENNSAYPKFINATSPTVVYSGSNQFKAHTSHTPALQTLNIFDPTINMDIYLVLDQLKQDTFATSSATLADTAQNLMKITIPQSDVILSALPGYFSFSPDQYFQPTPFLTIPITGQSDVDQVEYILAKYKLPQKDGEWSIAESEYDLSTASIQNGKLSWMIKSPGLMENNREIIIKEISVELTKKPLFNLPKI